MKFTKDEIRKAMLLYAVTDQMWLKEGERSLALWRGLEKRRDLPSDPGKRFGTGGL